MSIPNPIVLLDARAKYVHPAFQMSRASTKTVFDATGELVAVPANALGWDHDPATGQARGYLAEPSATNLLLHSNDLTQGAWGKSNLSITPAAITGPDGNGMGKLVEDGNLATHGVQQDITITDSNPIALSIIAKAAEREFAYLRIANGNDSTNSRALLKWHLVNGTLESSAATGTVTLVHSGSRYLGNGFWLLWLSATIGGGITNCRCNAYTGDSSSGAQYQGDGTSGIYAGYFQAGESSYPTSYIETGASTATRMGDNLVLPDMSDFPWWNNERGTVLVDVDVADFASMINVPYLIDFDQHIRFQRGAGGLIMTGLTLDSSLAITGTPVRGRYLLAMAWDGDSAIAASGGALTDEVGQSAAIPSDTGLALGGRVANTINQPNARIYRAVYYPQRLSNAALQSLTAIQE